MATQPPSTKRISLADLLARLVTPLLISIFLFWQLSAANQAALPPEIQAADRALRANNLKQAHRQFEALIATSPQDAGVYLFIMAACSRASHLDLCLAYGLRGLDACKYAPNPSRAVLCYAISALYAASHEPAPQPYRLRYARRAVELDPDNPAFLGDYGYILVENARTLPDINVGLGYIQKGLQNLRAKGYTANAAQSLKSSANAEQQLLLEIEDSQGWALYKRGQYDARDYARAVEALNQAMDDMPADMPREAQKIVYYHLGAACRAAGRVEEARHALQVALFYDPKYAEALRELNALAPQNTPQPQTVPPSRNASPVNGPDGKALFRPLDSTPASPSVK